MHNTTTYKMGEVVPVPFPFSDQRTTKKRPSVVISCNTYNKNHLDLIIMAITSQIPESLRFGELQIKNWKNAGLIQPSIIKPAITTIEKKSVIKKIGTLDKEDLEALLDNLKLLFNLTH
ncbi:hypothetical protein ES703_40052 [subsurface metagenome]